VTLTPSKYKSEIELPPLVSVNRNTLDDESATNENDATEYPTPPPGEKLPEANAPAPLTAADKLNACPPPDRPTANSTT
jgi:hypothetical protein